MSGSQRQRNKFNLKSTVIKGLSEFLLKKPLESWLNESENHLLWKGIVNHRRAVQLIFVY